MMTFCSRDKSAKSYCTSPSSEVDDLHLKFYSVLSQNTCRTFHSILNKNILEDDICQFFSYDKTRFCGRSRGGLQPPTPAHIYFWLNIIKISPF